MKPLDLGSSIRIARTTRGISISEFALLLSRSVAHMTRIEQNEISIPLNLLYEICDKLEFEIIEIILMASSSEVLAKMDTRLVGVLAYHYLNNMVNQNAKHRIREVINTLKKPTNDINEI